MKHDNFTLIIFDYIKINNEVKSENVNWKTVEKISSQKKLFSFVWKVKIAETENFTDWDKLKPKNWARWTELKPQKLSKVVERNKLQNTSPMFWTHFGEYRKKIFWPRCLQSPIGSRRVVEEQI